MTVSAPNYRDLRWDAATSAWVRAKAVIGTTRVTLGPQASQQWLDAPDHLAMVLARYRAAAALIGDAQTVMEIGCGEGIGASILAKGRELYIGTDTDAEAIADANSLMVSRSRTDRSRMSFVVSDACTVEPTEARSMDAIVALDVIEHIPAEYEEALFRNLRWLLDDHGVCAVGSPSANAAHLASPQSQAGHVNLYTPERLRLLLSKHFHVVQLLGMQDVALHCGHEAMWHYIMGVGIGPRR